MLFEKFEDMYMSEHPTEILIQRCLKYLPDERPGLEEVISHLETQSSRYWQSTDILEAMCNLSLVT